MKTIRKEVGRFEIWLSKMKGYSEHKEYHKLLREIDTYREKLFAEIESKEVRLGLAQSKIEISTMHPEIKKIIRIPDLPKVVVSLLEQAAS